MEFKLPCNRHFLFFFCFIASHSLNSGLGKSILHFPDKICSRFVINCYCI